MVAAALPRGAYALHLLLEKIRGKATIFFLCMFRFNKPARLLCIQIHQRHLLLIMKNKNQYHCAPGLQVEIWILPFFIRVRWMLLGR
jgi:hypothetical protein